jgi:RND family efflux transporter MFP subunit
MPYSTRTHTTLITVATVLLLSACGKGGSDAAGGAPAYPPAGVTAITLQAKPVERASEFIATLRSLRSSTIQPEVAGRVTHVLVKSGDRVRTGTPLIQIDPDRQQAAVQSTEASRSGAEADVAYWRQQVVRLQALVTAGAISHQEFDTAQNSLKTAEAKLATLQAQVSQDRVQLRFYNVVSPQDGIVGDISIRPGDRVTDATMITTIDDNSSLEAYVQVPLERAPELRLGLPVQLLDTDGKVAAVNPISFVAPRVDTSTQSVLVKSLLKDAPPKLRSLQFTRARIIWNTTPALTIPVVAVSRVSGQYFCFVAETQGGGTVARQRPVQVGDIIGDDYLVAGGLKAGERVITSGIQKLADGAPIKVQ